MFKVLIMGSSVSLRVRPPRQTREEGVYGELLERYLAPTDVRVINRAMFGTTIEQGLAAAEADVYREFPDVVIVHYGINDCAPRILPYWLWHFARAVRPRKVSITDLMRRVVTATEDRLRSPLLRLIGGFCWVGERRFAFLTRLLINGVRKEAGATVVMINMATPSDRVESLLPGFRRNVERYNQQLEQVASELEVPLIRVEDFLQSQNAAKLLPDGIHFSPEGHRLLASTLAQVIRPIMEEAVTKGSLS